jgi:hypothetical protein
MYRGRAFVAFVNAPAIGVGPIFVSDTGPLPASGGFRSASLLTVTVTGVLTAEVAVASTAGANGVARSSAFVANLVALPGHAAQLTASFLRSEATADCKSGVSGSSEVVSLSFDGQSVAVTGAPNQTVTIPGVATLVINEQVNNSQGGLADIIVNAIHLTVTAGIEIIISSAHADVSGCGPGPCHDFVTGGGWIGNGNNRKNFGFNVGFHDGSSIPDVHFNYIDHASGLHMRAISLTLYEASSPTGRHFEGGCEINGVPGFTYSITVEDNAEPGRGADTIDISLSNGHSAGGPLKGGNIQLHAPCSG